MRFVAPALVFLTALSQTTSAAPMPDTVTTLTNFFTNSATITLSSAQIFAADFVAVIPGLNSDIQNEGSLAGMAEDGEVFLQHFTGEVNSDIVSFEAFVALLERSA